MYPLRAGQVTRRSSREPRADCDKVGHMSSTRISTPAAWAVLVLSVAQALAVFIPLLTFGGQPNDDDVDLFISPTGYAFGIWAVIYLLSIATGVVFVRTRTTGTGSAQRLAIDLAVACGAAALWLVGRLAGCLPGRCRGPRFRGHVRGRLLGHRLSTHPALGVCRDHRQRDGRVDHRRGRGGGGDRRGHRGLPRIGEEPRAPRRGECAAVTSCPVWLAQHGTLVPQLAKSP